MNNESNTGQAVIADPTTFEGQELIRERQENRLFELREGILLAIKKAQIEADDVNPKLVR